MVAELRGSKVFGIVATSASRALMVGFHQPGIDLAVAPLDDLGWRTPY